MKEFGIYVLKGHYINEFSGVDHRLLENKGELRPFICVKDHENKNWLISCSKMNPDNKEEYRGRVRKYLDYQTLDKQEQVRALHIFPDVTGRRADDPRYKSVVQYYSIFPVKSKYCNPYRIKLSDGSKAPQRFLEKKLQSLVKKTFLENLTEAANGRLTGFIKARVEAGQKQFLEYPSKSFEILDKLYEKENQLIERREAKREQRQKQIGQSGALKPAAVSSGVKLMDLIKEIGGHTARIRPVAQAPPEVIPTRKKNEQEQGDG